mgnify:CR=1 FL=1
MSAMPQGLPFRCLDGVVQLDLPARVVTLVNRLVIVVAELATLAWRQGTELAPLPLGIGLEGLGCRRGELDRHDGFPRTGDPGLGEGVAAADARGTLDAPVEPRLVSLAITDQLALQDLIGVGGHLTGPIGAQKLPLADPAHLSAAESRRGRVDRLGAESVIDRPGQLFGSCYNDFD